MDHQSAFLSGFQTKLASLIQEDAMEKQAAGFGRALWSGAKAMWPAAKSVWGKGLGSVGTMTAKMPAPMQRLLAGSAARPAGPMGFNSNYFDPQAIGANVLRRTGKTMGLGAAAAGAGAYPAYDMQRHNQMRQGISNLDFSSRLALAYKLLTDPQGVAQMF